MVGRLGQVAEMDAAGAGAERPVGIVAARLAGQGPSYLMANLKRYQETGGARVDEKMSKAVKALNDDDMKALVAYIGSLR